MANVTLLGNTYNDVPAVDLPQAGGGTVRFYEMNASDYVVSDTTSGNWHIRKWNSGLCEAYGWVSRTFECSSSIGSLYESAEYQESFPSSTFISTPFHFAASFRGNTNNWLLGLEIGDGLSSTETAKYAAFSYNNSTRSVTVYFEAKGYWK